MCNIDIVRAVNDISVTRLEQQDQKSLLNTKKSPPKPEIIYVEVTFRARSHFSSHRNHFSCISLIMKRKNTIKIVQGEVLLFTLLFIQVVLHFQPDSQIHLNDINVCHLQFLYLISQAGSVKTVFFFYSLIFISEIYILLSFQLFYFSSPETNTMIFLAFLRFFQKL